MQEDIWHSPSRLFASCPIKGTCMGELMWLKRGCSIGLPCPPFSVIACWQSYYFKNIGGPSLRLFFFPPFFNLFSFFSYLFFPHFLFFSYPFNLPLLARYALSSWILQIEDTIYLPREDRSTGKPITCSMTGTWFEIIERRHSEINYGSQSI